MFFLRYTYQWHVHFIIYDHDWKKISAIIKLRWYREELPALLVTTTDAKQVSLPCLMSLAGAVSSSEEQTKD